FPFPSSVSSLSSQLPQETSAFVNTCVDWKETPEAHEFKVDLPGLKKEEVKVEIEDDRVLQISGERNIEKEDKNDTWHRVERSSGKFSRRFRLPKNVKMDQIKASMENGVLTVTVPKLPSLKPSHLTPMVTSLSPSPPFTPSNPCSDPVFKLCFEKERKDRSRDRCNMSSIYYYEHDIYQKVLD
ncbi:18.1 kDa class I heat shock protein-like, partial [Pistacia vera]|uniref:18.1 kDa class I heat shock protein-like n=1 Tax=Pistacia vera TaxID=55513 RepID=UPI0012635213